MVRLFFYPFLLRTIFSISAYFATALIEWGIYSFIALFNIGFELMNWCIYAILNSSESFSFFSCHILSVCMSDVRPYAKFSIFLSFGLFSWVSSMFILRKVPSILKMGLPTCFVSGTYFHETFSFVWDTRSSCSFIFACLMSAYNIHKNMKFSFSPSVVMHSWFLSPVPSTESVFSLFIIWIAYVLMLTYLPTSSRYILVCIRVSISFSVFVHTLMSSIYVMWLIFS